MCGKRYRKKIWLGLLCIALEILIASCGKKSDNERQITETVFFHTMMMGGNAAMSEHYLIYQSKGAYRIFDTSSKTDIPFCFEQNCDHRPPVRDVSGKVLVEGCPAYGFPEPPFFHGDGTLWFDGYSKLVRADREGKNRRTIAEIEIPISLIWDKLFTEKDMFYTYTQSDEYIKVTDQSGNSYWLPEKTLEKAECGVYRISLETGEQQYVFRCREYDSKIIAIHEYDDKVFFCVIYLDIPFEDLISVSDDEEQQKMRDEHSYVEIYGYDLVQNELQLIHKEKGCFNCYIGSGFFCLDGRSESRFFDMSGKYLHTLEDRKVAYMAVSVMENCAVMFVIDENARSWFELYDVVNNRVVKRVDSRIGSLKVMDVWVATGESFYCWVDNNGTIRNAWIAAEDFWNGNWEKMVIFKKNDED